MTIKRTFKSENGVKFQLFKWGDYWTFDISRRSWFSCKKNSIGDYDVYFNHTSRRGKWLLGTKTTTTRHIGTCHYLTEFCNALENYHVNGAWWK